MSFGGGGGGSSSIATSTDVALSNPSTGQALVYNSSLSKWQNTTLTGGASNATSSTPGLLQLTGDLGNTATSPQVTSTHLSSALPILQGGTGSTTQNFIDLTTAQSVGGVKTFTSSPIVPTPTTSTQAANKSYVDSNAGGSNATTSTPGLVQLAGDLANTATSPQVTSTHLSSALPILQGGTGSTTQNFVDLTTAQSIGGVKTFTSSPVVPTPSSSTQIANKGYVDSNAGASVGSATPVALGSAAAGSSASAARQDHVHPTTGLLLSSQQTSLVAVNIYNGSAYPARPSGYGSVEWIGPVDPGSSASTNDTWINTA